MFRLVLSLPQALQDCTSTERKCSTVYVTLLKTELSIFNNITYVIVRDVV
jgi:hypothetical protein